MVDYNLQFPIFGRIIYKLFFSYGRLFFELKTSQSTEELIFLYYTILKATL